jgi:hypothetical protein
MYGPKSLKRHGLADLPSAISVHLSLPCEMKQNAKEIVALAFLQNFTGPLEVGLPGCIY